MQRLFLAILSLAFVVAYIFAYRSFLHVNFDYAGFALFERTNWFSLWSVLISILPIIFFSRIRALSSIIATLVYVILYMPIVLTFMMGSDRPEFELVKVHGALFFGMSLLFLADRINLKLEYRLRLNFNFTKIILWLTLFVTVYLAIIYRSNLKLVGFSDVYEQRFANAEIGKDLITAYLSMWLQAFMVPICLAHGLTQRKKWYFLAGTLACLVTYLATASKGAVLFPIIFFAFYLLFRNGRIIKFHLFFLAIITSIIFLLTISTSPEQELQFIVTSLLLSRTIGNAGFLAIHYYDFFLTHPYTYFSHVGPINAITGAYPFGSLQLGQVVGQYYWSEDMGANANFWVSDGIASMGIAGVMIISVISFVILIIFNTVVKGHNQLFVVMSFLPFMFYIANTPLFLSMMSGGGLLLLLYFFIVKPNAAETTIKTFK
jgi:hypothetical protein